MSVLPFLASGALLLLAGLPVSAGAAASPGACSMAAASNAAPAAPGTADSAPPAPASSSPASSGPTEVSQLVVNPADKAKPIDANTNASVASVKIPPAVLTLTPADDLRARLARVAPNTILRLTGGQYELTPEPYSEETCGNCQAQHTRVEATVGLRVTGRSIAIVGDPKDPAVIHTRSGYGILFEDCTDCRLEGVTITDGIRDPDGHATDAAVVVKRSRVRLIGNRIVDNLGDSTEVQRLVVGIMGVAGREGAELTLVDNWIIRNSWDGVALYHGVKAFLRNNVIDGVDKALGAAHGGGRGVGIGVTWDSVADIRGNYVTRYWKGIGIFQDARATVEENIVEDVATWGLTLWDAGTGHPSAIFRSNAVFRTGACGASISATPKRVARQTGAGAPPPGAPPAGCLIGNAFVQTGQNPRYDGGDPYGAQTAIARDIPRAGRGPIFFPIEENLFFRNRESSGREGRNDQAEPVFRDAAQTLVGRLGRWSALKGSRFMTEFSSPKTATPSH